MTLHLKCSGEARKRIDALISATRADDRAVGRPGIVRVAVISDFNKAQSNLEQFIARLEQRVPKDKNAISPMSLGNEDRK